MSGEIRILVLSHGWVVVGKVEQSGLFLELRDSYVIERWGTTNGLGELVACPLPRTLLRPFGNWTVPLGALIMSTKAGDGWKSKF
jgi:hypothetical protein